MATQVIMPQLGESVVEGTVTRWLRREGESIQEFENLLEVDSDKVASEIPSPAGGALLKILVPEGTTVKAGTVLAWIGQPGEALPGVTQPLAAPVKSAAPEAAPAETQPVFVPAPGRDRDLGFISPVVARLAREKNVDLRQVHGSGEGGRITKKDVLAFLESQEKAAPAAWETPGEGDLFRPTELIFGAPPAGMPAPQPTPQPAPTPAAPAAPPAPVLTSGDRLLPHTTVRKAIAEHMLLSKRTSPHVTTVMEADMQRVVAHREANKPLFAKDGVNLTYTPYFIAAIIAGLKAYPQVNSSWSDEGLLLHAAVNVGMAVALEEGGLIVPVIRNADGLSLLGLARAVNDLAARARAHRLQPDEVKGGTFTLTNHGTGGSLFATPIINQPQCGILGVGAIQKRVVVLPGDVIAIRPMAYLSFTFDHRILDGASADAFLAKVVEALETP